MAARIQLFEPGTQYGDGLAADVQCALMSRTINTQRQPAGDHETTASQAARKGGGVIQPRP